MEYNFQCIEKVIGWIKVWTDVFNEKIRTMNLDQNSIIDWLKKIDKIKKDWNFHRSKAVVREEYHLSYKLEIEMKLRIDKIRLETIWVQCWKGK
jgi:hypothetical protein